MKKLILSVTMFMFVCGSFVANAQEPVKTEQPATEQTEQVAEEQTEEKTEKEESTQEAPAQEETQETEVSE